MKYLYHFLPQNFQGSRIYPLHQLQSIHPEAYGLQVKKYEGRPKLLKRKIEPLDCLWNDVVHLSPIHPQLIIDCWRAEGLLEYSKWAVDKIRIFKIPADKIDWTKTINFESRNYDFDNFDPSLNRWWTLSLEEYQELIEVPPVQIKIWHQDKVAGRKLFVYSHIQHVLVKDDIDVSNCPVVSCQ